MEQANKVDDRKYYTETKWLKGLILRSLPHLLVKITVGRNEPEFFYLKVKDDQILNHVIKRILEQSDRREGKTNDLTKIQEVAKILRKAILNHKKQHKPSYTGSIQNDSNAYRRTLSINEVDFGKWTKNET